MGQGDCIQLWKKLLEDASFDAPDLNDKDIVVDAEYVRDKMKDIVKDEDLTKYILIIIENW